MSYSIIISGCELFYAKKGLIQVDPLPPFFFVLFMEYSIRSLKTKKKDLDFNYHSKCAKLDIIQLGFTDDMLLFCKGDIISSEIDAVFPYFFRGI